MSGLGKGVLGVVRISQNGSGAGTFPDSSQHNTWKYIGASKMLCSVVRYKLDEKILAWLYMKVLDGCSIWNWLILLEKVMLINSHHYLIF